ncbi:MAG: zinc metallopeptidase [Candidatus Eisenbacteria bacterium]
MLFQLVTLPVEFDASRRAVAVVSSQGLVTQQELAGVKKVLTAAAMTYVAAAISSIATLLYYLFRAGLLGGSRND